MFVNAETVGLCKTMTVIYFKDVNGSLVRLTLVTDWQMY